MRKHNEAEFPYAVFGYVHHNKQNAALVTLECKTDFALRTDLIQTLGKQLAMHAAAFGNIHPDSKWLMDSNQNVATAIKTVADELGEPIQIKEVSVHGIHLNVPNTPIGCH